MKKHYQPTRYHLSENSTAAYLLREITGSLDDILTFGYRPTLVLRIGMGGVREMRDTKERAARYRALMRLRAKKLIAVRKHANEYMVRLTQDGQKEAFRLKVLAADLLPEGKVCMVVFDIPESQRKLRQQLRRFLDQAAFIPIQKSVWITPFDAGAMMQKLFSINEYKCWVRIFNCTELPVSKLIRSFRL